MTASATFLEASFLASLRSKVMVTKALENSMETLVVRSRPQSGYLGNWAVDVEQDFLTERASGGAALFVDSDVYRARGYYVGC